MHSEDEIISMWNANYDESGDGYRITPLSYNSILRTDESVTIGYGAKGNEFDKNTVTILYRSCDTIMTGDFTFEGDNYSVGVIIGDTWDTSYTIKYLITNTGKDTIHNWTLAFQTSDRIDGLYNAEIVSADEDFIVLRSLQYNQDIKPGEVIELGYTGTYDNRVSIPDRFMLSSVEKVTDCEDYQVDVLVADEWDEGALLYFTIENLSCERIEDWSIEFDSKMKIVDIWNAYILSHEEERYSIMNMEHSQNIEPGESCSIGIRIEGHEYEISNVLLKEIKNADLEKDSDGDGLSDKIEDFLGTNKSLVDTDGDGLTDYFEYSLCDTSPMLKDTDDDGIEDGEEDEDGDGLSNYLEFSADTDPILIDTDGDGLSDFDEVCTYGTNPLIEDTDGDELNDYDDIKLGFSPFEMDTDKNGIIDSDEILEQIFIRDMPQKEPLGVSAVSVEIAINGNIDNQISICDMYGIDELSSCVVGLIGRPVEINCISEFESANIVFEYDPDYIGDSDENDLAIMWYDEKNNCYTLLEESVVDTDSNRVSYETTHFSTYMLVDKSKWFSAWKENIDYREGYKNKYDIVFLLDASGSMYGESIDNAKKALSGFIDVMDSDDYMSIVRFDSYPHVVTGFSNDKLMLKGSLEGIYASGGTDVDDALKKAHELFKYRTDTGNKKIIVLLCDGDVNYNQQTIDEFVNDNLSIYTINVGYEYAGEDLKKMSEKTGGEYYFCQSVKDYNLVFGKLEGDTFEAVDPTDTDGDGLFDVYETKGIRLINGMQIATDPEKKDTDDDGLSDYDEIGIVYSGELKIGTLSIFEGKYVLMKSNPTNEDSDFDSILDPDDDQPWKYNRADNLLIYMSDRRKKTGENGADAEDLLFNDKSYSDICTISMLMAEELGDARNNVSILNNSFYDLVEELSEGDMKSVAHEMVDHMLNGTGEDYTNDILTSKVFLHESTQKYINSIIGELCRKLVYYNGNLYELEFNDGTKTDGKCIYNWVQNNVKRPQFTTWDDNFNGLGICLHDTWASEITITSYSFDGVNFSGVVHFRLYDHFGLDMDDISGNFKNLKGFRSWYVLQHYTFFNGAFVPYTTVMDFDVPFRGNVNVSISGE